MDDDDNDNDKIGVEKTSGLNEKSSENADSKEIENEGKLILDATCASADIRYPTDLGLLNEVGIDTDKII